MPKLRNIEDIGGSAFNDVLTGMQGINLVLAANIAPMAAGDDDLNGWEGDDEIHGGADDDTLTGFDGNDILIGGAGEDWLIGWDGTTGWMVGLVRTGWMAVMARMCLCWR